MTEIIRLSDQTSVELITENERFIGIGAVHIAGVAMRSSKRPMNVEIRGPNGVVVSDYHIVSRTDSPEQVSVKLSMQKVEGGPMEWMLHTVRNRYNTADWTQGPQTLDGDLEIILKPIQRSFGGTVYLGLSYQYRYRSPEMPIYKILDRATWEIGGKAIGNEIWMRNGIVPSIVPIKSDEDSYNTEWFLPGIQQPNIFQFFPLQGALQGFTMAFHEEGALVTWPNTVSHTRTLLEKRKGDDVFVHWHEHCGDMQESFDSPVVEVLFAPVKATTNLDRVNLYEDVRATVWDELHAQIGMRLERVAPYGVMEEWGLPDLERYRTKGLPKLAATGIKTIMIPSEFENNMNVWGVSNMCCTVDLKVAETVGEKNLADFCSTARQSGMKIEMWGNTSLSTLTDIFSRKNPGGARIDFLSDKGSALDRIGRTGGSAGRNASGAIEADHYTPVFACMNLRKPAVREYWLEKWGYAHKEIGLEGIFIDSSFNLSLDKFHFVQNAEGRTGGATIDQTALLGYTRPEKEPKQEVHTQYHAYLKLLVEMQAAGYEICVEDLGLFGVSRTGPDLEIRWPSLPMWLETICVFDPSAIQKIDEDPDHVYFAGLAHRLMWYHYWNPDLDEVTFNMSGARDDADRPRDFHHRLLGAFFTVTPLMVNRHVTEAWVRYEKDNVQCFWALLDSTIDLGHKRTVLDLIDGTALVTEKLVLSRHHVYTVS